MGCRSTVGPWFLAPMMGVRFPPPQPDKRKGQEMTYIELWFGGMILLTFITALVLMKIPDFPDPPE